MNLLSEKNYRKIDIDFEINKKINSLDRTRNNRIEMSKRLKGYDNKWKALFFGLNMEAIFFVLLSIGAKELIAELNNSESAFLVFSGLFSIYVILLQYFINGLNYSERALKLHYHQLEIEDCILKLKELFIKKNTEEAGTENNELIKSFNIIMNDYQSILKNNENHDSIDDIKSSYEKLNVKVDTSTGNQEKLLHRKYVIKNKESKKANRKYRVKIGKSHKKSVDLTVDNHILNINYVVVVMLPIYFIFKGWGIIFI